MSREHLYIDLYLKNPVYIRIQTENIDNDFSKDFTNKVKYEDCRPYYQCQQGIGIVVKYHNDLMYYK